MNNIDKQHPTIEESGTETTPISVENESNTSSNSSTTGSHTQQQQQQQQQPCIIHNKT